MREFKSVPGIRIENWFNGIHTHKARQIVVPPAVPNTSLRVVLFLYQSYHLRNDLFVVPICYGQTNKFVTKFSSLYPDFAAN